MCSALTDLKLSFKFLPLYQELGLSIVLGGKGLVEWEGICEGLLFSFRRRSQYKEY